MMANFDRSAVTAQTLLRVVFFAPDQLAADSNEPLH